MSVIAGNRAEELYLVALAPGLLASVNAELHSSCNGIVHKSKAGVAANDDVCGSNAQKVGKKLLSLADTGKEAVVSYINAVRIGKVGLAVKYIEHRHTEFKLLLAGLSS